MDITKLHRFCVRGSYPSRVHISTGVKLLAFDALLLFSPTAISQLGCGYGRLCVSCTVVRNHDG